MRRIGVAERRARLVARHHLAGGASAGVAGVAGELLALHATDAATVYLSAWARVPELTIEHVDTSLYDDRALVRMLGMRRTMFVVPSELRPVVQAACGDDVAARLRRGLIKVIAEAGIAADADAWLTEVAASALSELTARGTATAAELSRAEPRLATKIMVAEDKSYGGAVSLTSRILNLMSAEGLIVRGRPRGGWTSTQYEWAATGSWLGDETGEPVPAAAARVELARRWLHAFGPAPVSDLKWWTGWTAAQVKQTLTQLDTTDVDLDGQPGIMLTKDEGASLSQRGPCEWAGAVGGIADSEMPRETAPVLLPALDPTPMGWHDRDWMFGDPGVVPRAGTAGPHREMLFDRSGNIGPTIWWQGRIVGGWAQRADGEIALRLLEDVGADATRLVQAEGERLSLWMGRNRFVPKFRTPLERELSQ
jgi:hypothetical protein